MNEMLFRQGGVWFDAYSGIIPGTDVRRGVRMGDGFLDALCAPLELKEVVMNESRVEDGRRVVKRVSKIAARSLTLTFVITADDRESFNIAKSAFCDVLYGQWLDIRIPDEGEEVYHLRYTGKSTTYNRNLSGTVCQITAKFEEDNPKNRV